MKNTTSNCPSGPVQPLTQQMINDEPNFDIQRMLQRRSDGDESLFYAPGNTPYARFSERFMCIATFHKGYVLLEDISSVPERDEDWVDPYLDRGISRSDFA